MQSPLALMARPYPKCAQILQVARQSIEGNCCTVHQSLCVCKPTVDSEQLLAISSELLCRPMNVSIGPLEVCHALYRTLRLNTAAQSHEARLGIAREYHVRL